MGSKFSVSPGFCIFMALMVLLVPLQWVMAMLLAAAIHELCHYGAIRLFGKGRIPLQLGFLGASMPLPSLTRGQEVLCTLAGPIGSLLLFALVSRFPRLAICGMIHGFWNLMPVYPLDGGRILRGLLEMIFTPPVARKISAWVEKAVCCLLLMLEIYAFIVWKLGFLPVCIAAMFLFRCLFRKTPCKAAHLGVQ